MSPGFLAFLATTMQTSHRHAAMTKKNLVHGDPIDKLASVKKLKNC